MFTVFTILTSVIASTSSFVIDEVAETPKRSIINRVRIIFLIE
jgi:hypothetical protein